MTTKSEIREIARSARRSILAEERAVRSASACGRLLGLPEAQTAHIVLGYVATNEELDPARCLASMRDNGTTVGLPRIAGPGALTVHIPFAGLELESGPHGIKQPHVNTQEIDPEEIDVVVVPGVAFDLDGRRVGYGGGYYDRLLRRSPNAVRIALAFDEQIIGDIPHEQHDERVDIVVTPTRVIRIDETLDA